jgi:hypothetical protein
MIGMEAFTRLCNTWSDKNFAKHADKKQLRSMLLFIMDVLTLQSLLGITDAILTSLNYCNKEDLESSSVLPTLISGVQQLFESQIDDNMNLGMVNNRFKT